MNGRPTILAVALAMFGAGAALAWVLHDAPADLPSGAERSDRGLGVGPLTSRLDAIDRRLAALEDGLAALGSSRQGAAEVPIATRGESQDLSQLRQELQALCDEVHTRMAGLGELQARKPQPDVGAVNELRTRTGGDMRLVRDAIYGLTYRDVVLQFGSPTGKFAPLTGPDKFRNEVWLWEFPSGDLDVTFVQGAAIGGSFHSSGVMRTFLEEK